MNKQNEKYKTMLKRKNKEKKIYKDKNASLQLEKQILYKALINREHEIERLNNIIKEAKEYIELVVKNTPSSMRKDYANMLLIDYKKLLEILDKGE